MPGFAGRQAGISLQQDVRMRVALLTDTFVWGIQMKNKGVFAGVGVISMPAPAGFKSLGGIQGQSRTVSFPYFQKDTFDALSGKRPQSACQQRSAEAPTPEALMYRQIVHFRLTRRAVQTDKHIGREYPDGREKTEAEKMRFPPLRRGLQDTPILFRAEARKKAGRLQGGNGIGVTRFKRGYAVFGERRHREQCSVLPFFCKRNFIAKSFML
jgi:hypothetical protein